MDQYPKRKEPRWPSTKHLEGKISVTIDNNAWDFLYENRIDLASELPADQFVIFIPREVEIEVQAIPDTKEKRPLRDFIRATSVRANVRTSCIFGFHGPEPQRHGGWGRGTFITQLQAEILDELRCYFGTKTKGSGLQTNEGDVAVAMLSFSSVVLTNENAKGPLRFASESGGKILWLRQTPEAARYLRQCVLSCYHGTDG